MAAVRELSLRQTKKKRLTFAYLRARSRSITRQAIKQGLIKRARCQDCGSKDSMAHHPDYLKPLVIKWLCKSCHAKEHYRIDWGSTKRHRTKCSGVRFSFVCPDELWIWLAKLAEKAGRAYPTKDIVRILDAAKKETETVKDMVPSK